MANERQAWGRAASPTKYVTRDGEEKVRWVRVGNVYRNQDGSLRLQLDAIPAHWFREPPEVVFFREEEGDRKGGKAR